MLSLNVDDRVLRLLVTQRGRARRWATVSLEPGTVSDGVVRDRELFLWRLRSLADSLMVTDQLRGAPLRLSVTGRNVLLRRLHIAREPSVTIGHQVAQACAEQLPVPLDELEWGWRATARHKGALDLYCLGLYRNAVAPNLEALRHVGVVPSVVEPKVLALTRVVSASNALVLDTEVNGIELVVIRDGIPDLFRTTRVRDRSVSDREVGELALAELERVTAFYNSAHQDDPLPQNAPLYLTGARARRPELRHRLQTAAPHPLRYPSPHLAVSAYFPTPEYAVNLGLGLRAHPYYSLPVGDPDKRLLEINLLPAEFRYDYRKEKRALMAATAAAAVGLLFPLYQLQASTSAQLAQSRAQLRVAETQLRSRIAHIRRGEELQRSIEEAQGMLDRLDQQTQIIRSVTGQLAEAGRLLRQRTFPGLSLLQVSDDGDTTLVRGEAQSFDQVLRYVDSVRQEPLFSRINLDSMSRVASGTAQPVVQFSLSAER